MLHLGLCPEVFVATAYIMVLSAMAKRLAEFQLQNHKSCIIDERVSVISKADTRERLSQQMIGYHAHWHDGVIPGSGNRSLIVDSSLAGHVETDIINLTHLPLVSHICVGELDQHWFR